MKNTKARADIYSIILYAILIFCGSIVLGKFATVNGFSKFLKQYVLFLPLAIGAFWVVINRFNVDFLKKYHVFFYVVSTLLLIGVLFTPVDSYGARRHYSIFGISFQPSYLARLMMINSLAIYIEKNRIYIEKDNLLKFVKNSLWFFIYTGLSFILIHEEPHLSVLMITGAALGVMFFISGLSWKKISIIAVVGVALVSIAFFTGGSYRGKRIHMYKKYCLLFPKRNDIIIRDRQDQQIRQSLAALSAGGFFGTSSEFGIATRKFVPEADTDYIFAVFGEEFGFIGASILLIIYVLLFFRLLKLSQNIENYYYKYFAIGLNLNLFFTAIVNIGVATALLPSTGVSLPFVSYGGSAFVLDTLSLALILKIIKQSENS